MLSYEEHFKSQRADGRHISTMAALMEQMRKTKPELTLPEELTPESFAEWQKKVKEKIRELLCLPEATPQPAPVLLSRAQREGYTVEKWEFYPDDYTAVPYLALIPDGATAEHPVMQCILFLTKTVPDYGEQLLSDRGLSEKLLRKQQNKQISRVLRLRNTRYFVHNVSIRRFMTNIFV